MLARLLPWLLAGAIPADFAVAGALGTGTLVAGVFEPPRMAPELTLAATDGAALQLAHYRGKVTVLSFGYSSCTEVCPVTLAVLARARKLLGAEGAGMQVVYVTVDPDRDTVAHLKGWLDGFDPAFIGGTGTAAQLAAARASYGVMAQRNPMPNGDYSYAHSSFTLLIDRAGRLRALMPFGHQPEDYAHDVRILLHEPAARAAGPAR
jgi:protein SCO1/2